MKRFLFLPAVIAAGSLFTSCTNSQKVLADHETVKVESAADPNVFSVEKPEEFPLVEAVAERVHEDIQANGVVAPDVSRTVPVMSLSSGRVLEINARVGDEVKKGQWLLRIHSSDLAGAYADYQKAVSDEMLARKTLDRSKELLAHGAAAQKDAEIAEGAEEKALIDVKNTAEKIRILGGSVEHPTAILDVTAPVSGTVVEQNIQASGGVKSLDNSPNLFTIADLSQVWIVCDLYENNLSQVKVGDNAEVRLSAYPDRVFKARVSNISRVLDPATRTAKVRLEVPNNSGVLRPGMFATAHFFAQGTTERIALPATAVLRLHDKDWIFRPAGDKQFRREEVASGAAATESRQYIIAGVKAGDRVVRNALQFSATVEK